MSSVSQAIYAFSLSLSLSLLFVTVIPRMHLKKSCIINIEVRCEAGRQWDDKMNVKAREESEAFCYDILGSSSRHISLMVSVHEVH